MRSVKSAFVGGVVAFALFSPGAASAQGAAEFIVQFREGTTPAARRAVGANAGAAVRFVYNRIPAATFDVPNEQSLSALRNNPDVVSIVPNRPVFAFQRANGKPVSGGGSTSSQVVPAGVQRVGVPTASSDGEGVGVAILDTGVDLAHQDLAGTVNAFSAFGSSCQDQAGHGTHVAGIVGARDNATGVIGVAPSATLYCVRVLDQTGSGSDATVMAGLDWVLTVGASLSPAVRVVNMSLGRPGTIDDNPALRDLIAALDAAGIVVVASAGNDPTVDVIDQIPAAYAQVISVASTTAAAGANQCRLLAAPIAADTSSYFTTDGTRVSVSAPGEDQEDVSRGCLIKSVGILSTKLGGGTTRMSGTSMAAPHVAGIAARHLQQNPDWSPADVRIRLAYDATRQGVAPLDSPTSSYTFDGVREGVVAAP
jgi:subtilisin family serine protease